MSEPNLYELQAWMKTVITTRGNLKQKLEHAAETFQLKIEDVVESKRGVSAERRLDIYAAGYVLRLLECMKCDYPGLMAFMGETLFDTFAKAYIVSLPPQSWSLFHLSERFPQFLRATEPDYTLGDLQQQQLIELPAEIAAFERAKAELNFAKGTEGDPDFNTNAGFDLSDYLLGQATIHASPCLRLLKQKFPVNDFLNGLQQGLSPKPPEQKTTHVALTRTYYRIRVAELEHWQYAFLNCCLQQPGGIHACAQKAAEESGINVQTILAGLMIWLPVMVEMGAVVVQSEKTD
jgi:hypothetical protein